MNGHRMMLGRLSSRPWWYGAYVAWQPFGATDATAARADLTGGGRDMTGGGTPTWTEEEGITSATAFDSIPNILDGGSFTALWVGRVKKYCEPQFDTYPWHLMFCSPQPSAPQWSGAFIMHTWTSGFFAGANSAMTYRFSSAFASLLSNNDLVSIVYRKNGTDQNLFFKNHTTGAIATPLSRSGTPYSLYDIAPCTGNGGSFRAAAIWRASLAGANITTIMQKAGI